MAASPRSPTPQTPTAKKASTPPKTVPDRDLRDAMNGLLNLAASLRRMERDATANWIGRLEIPELHGRAWQAFNRDGVAGFLLMCPEGDMPAGSNVFLEILDRSARVQRGETGLMPLNWADVLIRVHRNVDAAQKRRDQSRGREADIAPHLGGKVQKKSTSPGAAQQVLGSTLVKWHQYDEGSVGNWAAVGVRELADMANVTGGSATNFFNKRWGNDEGKNGHDRYKAACAHKRILDKLRELAGDEPLREFRNSFRDDLYADDDDGDHDD